MDVRQTFFDEFPYGNLLALSEGSGQGGNLTTGHGICKRVPHHLAIVVRELSTELRY